MMVNYIKKKSMPILPQFLLLLKPIEKFEQQLNEQTVKIFNWRNSTSSNQIIFLQELPNQWVYFSLVVDHYTTSNMKFIPQNFWWVILPVEIFLGEPKEARFCFRRLLPRLINHFPTGPSVEVVVTTATVGDSLRFGC